MALPTFHLSTPITNVDCSGSGKILFLPPASTIQGVSFWIRDATGTCSQANSIYLSTQGLDRIDRHASTLRLSSPYQSVRCVAWHPTHYAVLQNYTNWITPFLVQLIQNLSWTQRASLQPWSGVASNPAFTVLLASVGGGGGQLYLSVDQGVSWSSTGPSLIWTDVATSQTGSLLVAVSNGDRIYISTDLGVSWSPRASAKTWTSVCCSSDGTVLLAAATSDFLFVSTDSGVTWTATNVVANYTSVACSSDGTIFYAVATGDQIYVSTDSGGTWTARDSVRNWRGVACSSDGTIAYATEGSFIYTSTTTGTSWSPNTNYVGSWGAIVCSQSGTIVGAVNGTDGFVYFSDSAGASYRTTGDPGGFTSLACNGTGTSFLVSESPGYLYTGDLQLL